IFTNQTEWIRDHRQEYNIQYVLHEGDITNNNNFEQWNNSNNSMRVLDGQVPYTLTTGNHDMGPNGNAANRDTYLNDFFPSPQYENWSTFGGAYEKGKLENTYHVFSEAGLDWMIVSLEFAPRDAVLEWANQIISDHPGRMTMVVTHNYLAGDARNPWLGGSYGVENDPAGANTGEEIWQKCIRRHKNIICVFSGHILVESGYLASTGNHGNTVHQMLANFQMNERGGDAFMRILEFNTSAGSIEVRTY
ncbi:MAG: metallophosphoesterase, partial [Thermoplasmata archaeon]|nr:metallophosphoesterase [Thermoplasmata archaeon]